MLTHTEIATTPEVDALLAFHAPVAIGVSGGKDSCALAIALNAHLDAVGHDGPRILIHSDLGRVEWRDSLPTCERLAKATGLELLTVRRAAGDMMDRWLTRWSNNVARYTALECVKLILPWSTASMRFCTSEMKTDVICRALVKRFPGETIISASGIRRDESRTRAKAPVVKPQPKLTSATHSTSGLDWHPIIDWTLAEVLGYLYVEDFSLHEAYTRFGSSRVSCAFCILGSQGDLRAAAGCADNHDLYREMVGLEACSTFAFHDSQWLGDVAPHLLSQDLREKIAEAKYAAAEREAAEARIPNHLLYTKGWPTCIPSRTEAEMLCQVRDAVANVVGLSIEFTTPESLVGRYQELMAAKLAKGAA